jgi:hypothetical protein
MCCAELASVDGSGLLEEHLRRLQAPLQIQVRNEVRQIDKLARYYFLYRDFIKIARRPNYRHLFDNITVEALKAFEGVRPNGSSTQCFVHAEIQQVVHYIYHPHNPSPRFISCSKAACYLCDMFIKKHGLFRISHAHRRLYEKWTLPCLDCSSSTEAQGLPAVLKSMMEDIAAVTQRLQSRHSVPKQYVPESKAFLPLTSGSTPSITSISIIPSKSSTLASSNLESGFDAKSASSTVPRGD